MTEIESDFEWFAQLYRGNYSKYKKCHFCFNSDGADIATQLDLLESFVTKKWYRDEMNSKL